MIDLRKHTIPPTPGFDPARGAQSPSTGVVGGLYFAALLLLYSIFSTEILENGGPNVLNALSWMPARFSFPSVPRAFYDVIAALLLCFLTMLTWERVTSPVARGLIVLILVSSLSAGYFIAGFGAHLFFADDLYWMGGWLWTQMEALWAWTALALMMIWSIPLNAALRKTPCRTLPPLAQAFTAAGGRWVAGWVLFSAILLLAFGHPYYQSEFFTPWRILVAYAFSTYLILGLPYLFFTHLARGKKFEARSDPLFNILLLSHGFWLVISHRESRLLERILRNRRVRVCFLDLLVKLFFLPLMANFILSEASGLQQHLPRLLAHLVEDRSVAAKVIFDHAYWVAFHAIFCIDVGLGMLGYAASSCWLNNRSKSVEPTLLGWVVTLACYPPFNEISGIYLPFKNMSSRPNPYFQAEWIDIGLKMLTIAFWSLYVSATMAFGLRFSNLTHRGIITRGPYAWIRHPAYLGKTLATWTLSLPTFTDPRQYLFLLAWNAIYYLRAMTEERHLRLDPDYRRYCERVRYRFIPGIW